MKKTIKTIVAAILLIAFAMSLAACGNKNVYDALEDGYTIKVRFDASGALVKGAQNVTIVEVYNENDVVTNSAGKTGVALLAPDDPLRKETEQFKLSKADEENGTYFQIGWYRDRTSVVDENGNVTYTYSGKWDFAKDVVTPDDLTDGEMTLYAAWAPLFTYEFYAQNESGKFEKIELKDKLKKLTLLVPEGNEETKEVTMNDFPSVDGKTFASAYLDEAMTQEIAENLDGRTLYVDYEKGIAKQSVIKIYIAWAEE